MAFLAGVFVGAFIGVLAAGLLAASGNSGWD